MADDLIRMTARAVVALLARRAVAARAHRGLARPHRGAVEPLVNALPTLCPERAVRAAEALPPESLLAGLPLAIKDLVEVAGVRTTRGSPLYAEHISPHSTSWSSRLQQQGGIVIASLHTPEFGAGGNTFNEALVTLPGTRP